jgi:hypothetical protein
VFGGQHQNNNRQPLLAGPGGDKKDAAPFPVTTGGTKTDATTEHWAISTTRVHNKGRSDERKIPIILGFQRESLNETQFKHTTKETCANCDSVVNFKAVYDGDDKVRFINRRQFLCEDCGNDEWVDNWFVKDVERNYH